MSARRTTLGAIAAGLLSLAIAPAAQADGPYPLVLDQGSAFSILGHSCGGIQEESLATGFAPSGYPEGDVHLSTRCGGSGRGGGYKTTTYTAWATVVWNWFGDVRSFSRLEGTGGSPGFEATDSHGDRVYDSGTRAYLETGEPPLRPPAAPSAVTASVFLYEEAATEAQYLRMSVAWSLDPETAGMLTSSTVTATPVVAGPPVLTATAGGSSSSAYLGPVAPNTTYRVTVTSTDAEGTSEPSAPFELTSPNGEGEAEKGGTGSEVCELASGTIKLSPGLTETPHVQSITLKGQLQRCDGPAPVESATFVAHETTIEEVTCGALQSLSAEPTTAPVSLVVKWSPTQAGVSHGSLLLPVTEAGGAILGGSFEGGPFGASTALAGSLSESFAGAATCGAGGVGGVGGVGGGEGGKKKKEKPVKNGLFSGSGVELG